MIVGREHGRRHRSPADDRSDLPDRVAALDRGRSRGSCATSASRKSSRRTRSSPRSSSGRPRACPTSRARGSWRPRSTARSTRCAAELCEGTSTLRVEREVEHRPRGRSTTATSSDSTTRSVTICCGSSSSPAIRCSRPRLASRSRSACSAASRPTRSRARFWYPSRRSRSGSCARSGRSPMPRVPFELPRGAELGARLVVGPRGASISIFNEGYSATAGDDWIRPAPLRGRATPRSRAGRARAARARGARARRAHGDPGVARSARGSARGRADPAARSEPRALGPAAHPPRARVAAAIARAADARRGAAGPYTLQASIAACHARAARPTTDWKRIAALYGYARALSPRRSSS